jgi:hypothetical protein
MKRGVLVFILGVWLAAGPACADQRKAAAMSSGDSSGTLAVSSDTFLSSLGVNTHVDQGVSAASYVAPLKYLGIRNIRDSQRHVSGYIMLHETMGIHVDLLGADVTGLIAAAKELASYQALLSIEGPNEPNNFPVIYQGQKGGGTTASWVPVAQLQKDLYHVVKSDPQLQQYPVFHVSEGGAEVDNVGLQFLTIPAEAKTLLPPGTKYADYANTHNYVIGNGGGYEDNQAWKAADPVLPGRWDGLSVEYGRTWKGRFDGYSEDQLQTLPRVTTETGWDSVGDPGGERIQGTVLVNTYLAQFKRGWRYTFIYQLRDNEGGGGNQGLYRADGMPKLSATYIHNLTSILADDRPVAEPHKLDYTIANEPSTVHDLLLEKSTGVFALVIWGEQVSGSNDITANFATPRALVKVYDPTVGTTPIKTYANVSSVPLTMSDHALILEVQ